MEASSQNIWVVGLGAISSIGNNVAENLNALQTGKDGVGHAEFLQTIHRQQLPVCEIKYSNEQLAQMAGMPNDLPRTVYLSAIAAKESIKDIQEVVSNHAYKVGFISGNTIGGMDLSEHFYAAFLENEKGGRLQEVVYHECGSITELVAQHLNISDYVTTLSTACSSSANAIMQAAQLIKHKKLDIAIAGGADALCKFTLNGFNTLMILDTEPCKPFDENRKGLNLGEGAGYVVLVSEEVKNGLNLDAYARLTGYCNANDAFHQTASSAEGHGNYLAMEGALKMSGLHPSDIHYINAHGTGTNNNDSSEGMAIQRLFGEHIPKVSSTKGNTGHTLGACGGLEAVYSILAMKNQCVFPNLRWKNPIPSLHFIPNTTFMHANLQNVMSNSFGFGGNCSSLVFSAK